MTFTDSPPNIPFWDTNLFTPQPTQDTELLQQLQFLPGLKEMLMLRQVHALEHGTVWVLGERKKSSTYIDDETLGGLSTEKGFYLYGKVHKTQLQRAVHLALERFQNGEWDLAVHPRCGTNFSVAVLLTGGLVLGSHLLFPRTPWAQLLGLGLAINTATQLTPDLGRFAQKYLTTSVPFNLTVDEIVPTSDIWGRSSHFVRVKWQDLQ